MAYSNSKPDSNYNVNCNDRPNSHSDSHSNSASKLNTSATRGGNKKHKSSRSWLKRHINDSYVKEAKSDGYRSRAAYKLLELANKYHLLKKDVHTVVDLGCAPGSWAQVVIDALAGLSPLVIGIDLLDIRPLAGLQFIRGDFSTDATLDELLRLLDNRPVDLLICDIAPNLSGIRLVDQAKCASLVELTLDFASNYLRPGGNCIIKLFQGGEFNHLMNMARDIFTKAIHVKPSASRQESSEMYLLGLEKL